MKPPSTSISRSLARQRPAGRDPITLVVSRVEKRRLSMIVPGSGGVEYAAAIRHERSAAAHADVLQDRFGGRL
jgi:hypothetical protein